MSEDDLDDHLRKRRQAFSMNGLADSALQGVTVSFLAQVFRMDPAAVKRRLVNCPILESRRRGQTQVQHLYDLATASAYLVEKDVDLAEVIAKVKKEDLPPSINTAYWDARLKRQKFEENAGDLWRTAKVWEALMGTFQTMKFTIDLWAETVERQTGLTEQQREIIYGLSDGLKSELYDALVKQAEEKRTGSQIDEIPEDIDMRRDGIGLEEDDLDDPVAALV